MSAPHIGVGAVFGFPLLPKITACRRLTAPSPSFMSLHACLMRKQCALTICTTRSLKSVLSALLDFGSFTAHATSVLTSYQAVCFYWAATSHWGTYCALV